MTRNQLTYFQNMEAARANRAKEDLTRQQNFEARRSNLAKEGLARFQNYETKRSNLAKETETNRSNLVNESRNRDVANAQIGRMDVQNANDTSRTKAQNFVDITKGIDNGISITSKLKKGLEDAIGLTKINQNMNTAENLLIKFLGGK
nr:putative ORF1 [Marmot picobirnavirus]